MLSNLAIASGDDNNLQSRRKLAEVRLLLARANAEFRAGRYQAALDLFKQLRSTVYGLIQPSFSPDMYRNPSLRLPDNPALFTSFMTASLDMVEKLSPATFFASNGVSTLSLPRDVQKEMAIFAGADVTAETGVKPEVSEAAHMGAEYMAGGEWRKAAAFFQLGLNAVGGDQNEETIIARGSMEMNLGAALLQAGQADKAAEALKSAETTFAQAGDKFGQSQAKINQAAALAKLGKQTEADSLLAEADNLLGASSTGAPVRPAPTRGVVTPARPLRGARLSPRAVLSVDDAISRPATLAAGASTFGEATKAPVSISPKVIQDATKAAGQAVVLRMPGKSDGWVVQDLASKIENDTAVKSKTLSVVIAGKRAELKWSAGQRIDVDKATDLFYRDRVASKDMSFVNLRYDLDSDFALRLPHLYYFTLPIALADCYHELGQHLDALASYKVAANYQFLNTHAELPMLWIRIAENARDHGDMLFRTGKPLEAVKIYEQIMTLEEDVPNAYLYTGPLKTYGDTVAALIGALDQPTALNPKLVGIVKTIRVRLRMIKAGLNFWGIPTNYFPIFKFDYLQSIATRFAQLAIQAEREYISFTARGEDEALTRLQIEQGVEMGAAEVRLAEEQLDYAQAEVDVTRENEELAAISRQNAQASRNDFADAAYEQAALDAAMQFAGGPEGYSVSYTYYSPSEGKNVTLSGSDAYKVMADAAFKKGMISRELELANMDRRIAELQQNEQLANAQRQAAEQRVDVAEHQVAVAELRQEHAQEMLDAFNDQTFTPEVWFQLGTHLRWISKSHLQRAIEVAKKMQLAYELETGFSLSVIRDAYDTNIVSGLLGADYLLKDVEYFTFHRIMQVKAKDVPIKQEFSLAALNPTGFATVFQQTGVLNFELSLQDFDRAFPGSYLRKIKKVEIVVEGLLPPGGVTGSLKNSGISRDRRKTGEVYFRLQPRETLYLSKYNPRADIGIFQPNPAVLDVFELCGTATQWTLEIPPHANDLDYATVSDVKMIVYYTAQHDLVLEPQIKATLPVSGSASAVIPFRILLPDAYYALIDTGEMTFDLRERDFAFNQVNLRVRQVAVRLARQAVADPSGVVLTVATDGRQEQDTTDATGTIRSHPVDAEPLNAIQGAPLAGSWRIAIPEAANVGFDRSTITDLALFVEYDFDYRGA